jgi:hypothetical protein
MNQENLEKLEKSILNLKEKKHKIYFLVQDTKGNAKASISYIYRLAMSLLKAGYNPTILHEKPDYVGVGEWLGKEYMESLPHKSIEGTNLEVAPEDFIVVPELYGFVMPQLSKLPCGKIVLCQAYDYILETLQPGVSWNQVGFLKCITTSETQKEFVSNVMRNISFDILEPLISDKFKKQTLPSKPIITIQSREQRDTTNLVKSFYLKFPQYRWVTFKDMRGLTETQFAENLKESFLSIWIDELSGYGTFPLESMKTGVPVVGLVPNLVPSWMNENNGVWVNSKIQIVDYVADFLQNWLEDNINPNLLVEMDNTVSKLQSEDTFSYQAVNLFESYAKTRLDSFEEQLNKFSTIEQ